ncbi:type II toxin-antitoxin system HicB family antitoxin [Desulfococcaceae bacterium HSG8]|nr:type II toxin-antitoxin system HicB family antitoxin [Desulfococcaceae bacterium HSG8]
MMKRNFTLEYWIDDEWYVGRIKEVPGVFSQGETLEELEENVKDAFKLMTEDDSQNLIHPSALTKEIVLEVA